MARLILTPGSRRRRGWPRSSRPDGTGHVGRLMSASSCLSAVLFPVVDERDDLVEPWPVAVGGVDLDPGSIGGHAVERVVALGALRRVVRPWVGMGDAQRAVRPATQASLEGHIGV